MSADEPHHPSLHKLIGYLERVPAISPRESFGSAYGPGGWWLKFRIDIDHPLAWPNVRRYPRPPPWTLACGREAEWSELHHASGHDPRQRQKTGRKRFS